MQTLLKLNRIFSKKTKIKLCILLIAIIIGAVFEMLALAVISPFISIIMDSDMIHTNEFTDLIFNRFGFSNTNSFLAFLAFILVFIYAIRSIYLYLLTKVQSFFIARRQSELSVMLLDKIQKYPYLYHVGKNIAELQRIVLVDVLGASHLTSSLLQLLTDFFMIFFIVIFLLILSPIMTLCVLLLAGICVFLYFVVYRRIMVSLGKKNRIAYIEMTKSVNQALGSVKEIKVLQRESYFLKIFKKNSDINATTHANNTLISSIPNLMIEAVCFGGTFLILGILFITGVDISRIIPELSMFVIAAFRLLPAIVRITARFNSIIYQRPAVDGLYKTLFEDDSFVSTHKYDITQSGDITNDINIYDITFQYPNTLEPVLKDVSLVIPENKSIALIGTTGAGKTTLADITLGIYSPSTGYISYKGMYSTVDENWSRSFGYIPQQIYLLDETIQENVAFGIDEDEIDKAKVWKALEQAQVADFVRSLPDGLNTYVGDRGIRLSGGQRQRIGIARALYDDPPILILDEATSSLDDDTEAAVMEAITGFHGKKTMLIIAHRLSTIEHCDIVYRVEDKKVVRER
ncbi:MAG: ABC transporter ATP-binding protein/permease [Oscillospiraceae bacterium]|jgi:ABC-type multidrug transport system fused ATPase/permease subunit|nr:ABC transporter ATP-binding protein/permease [Oscillospiraceae bacterium]